VKALLDPIIDFGVKTSGEAYAGSLPPFLKNAIAQHDVLVGMDRRMVLAAMGAPLSKLRELEPGSVDKHYEEWLYGQVPQTVRFVRFVGDRVVQVRVAELGKAIAIHDQDEMHGYLDPVDVHDIAMGDARPRDESGNAQRQTILKQGEVAPGSDQPVLMPVSAPPKDRAPVNDQPQARTAKAPATTSGVDMGDAPGEAPDLPMDKPAKAPAASGH